MKALALALPFLLCAFSFKDGGFVGVVGTPPAAGGGSCSTVRDVDGGTMGPNDRTTAGVVWYGQRIVASATYTSCKVELQLGKAGTPAGNVTVHIYSHDNTGDGTPDTSLGSANIAFADISTTVGTESVTIAASISSGTTYWVVVNDPQGGGFSGNHLIWRDFSTGAGGVNHEVSSSDGANWAEFNNNTRFTYSIYSD